MKQTRRIEMTPAYPSLIFRDEQGHYIGEFDYIILGDYLFPLSIPGLKDWINEWYVESLLQTHQWDNNKWLDWWQRGYELAKEVKKHIPEDVELYYFHLNENVWKVHPNEYNNGGKFDKGTPLKIE